MRNKPERIFIDKLNHYSYKYIELKETNHPRFNTPEIPSRNRPSIKNSLEIKSPKTNQLGRFESNKSFDCFM